MAVDMFLLLNGVDGESQDDTHGGEIDVLAWSWGASQSGSTHISKGSGAGKVNVQDIAVTHYTDSATPALLGACANGTHIPDGQITVRKAGDPGLEYLIIKMKNIIVTSVSMGGSGGEDRLTDNFTLNFAEYEVAYQPQGDDGGKDGGAIESKFNIAKNIKL